MKKKLIITGLVIVAVIVGGYAAYRFGVSFLFDRYLLGTALSTISDGAEGESGAAGEDLAIPPLTSGQTEETTGNVFEQQESTEKEKKRLSNTEVISRVMRSSELTYKMASMVPYEEKNRIIRIILSNFTADELTEIAKNASKGIDKDYKSRMIAEARARLTPEQWKQCLDIAYKYIDKIRPYVE